MKLIAHRGAPLMKMENSLEALICGGETGADLVECDVTKLSDDSYVMYHDNSLKRLAGVDIPVTEVTYSEMEAYLKRCGYALTSFSYLLENYKAKTPILLHIKMSVPDADFIEMIRNTQVPFVFGAISAEMVRELSRYFPPERILAFMPGKKDYVEFYEAGAGNIRWWEHWLGEVTPEEVRSHCPNANVWIMARDANKSNRGSVETLNKCVAIGADGILMDDIALAVEWRKNQSV